MDHKVCAWLVMGCWMIGLLMGAEIYRRFWARSVVRWEIARWLRAWSRQLGDGGGFVNLDSFRRHLVETAEPYEKGQI